MGRIDAQGTYDAETGVWCINTHAGTKGGVHSLERVLVYRQPQAIRDVPPRIATIYSQSWYCAVLIGADVLLYNIPGSYICTEDNMCRLPITNVVP